MTSALAMSSVSIVRACTELSGKLNQVTTSAVTIDKQTCSGYYYKYKIKRVVST